MPALQIAASRKHGAAVLLLSQFSTLGLDLCAGSKVFGTSRTSVTGNVSSPVVEVTSVRARWLHQILRLAGLLCTRGHHPCGQRLPYVQCSAAGEHAKL